MLIGRRLAFDYGDVRIGVASCDPEGILATPVATVKNTPDTVWLEIKSIMDEYEPVGVFIGEPKHLSGRESESGEKAHLFAQAITDRFGIPCIMIDERLSTVSASRQMRESGKNAKESKSAIDQVAAVAILEQGLAILKREKNQ
ncbi:unannotated protein [freshwater metagenome]|uniref:Unannotated protein n=1 Tax=freshwater metagenome TaxID=449393 RepID=A0A6J7XPL7_9ZZZZ|nr:Holliday junction resolvase RuvX [Actinomycetota bacterium]